MAEKLIDEVGYWTEVKLEIIRQYSAKYTQILDKQKAIKHFAYIDGFAGAGHHVSKQTGKLIEGSPAIALNVNPPFDHCHFIDLNGKKTAMLEKLATGRNDVSIYRGDCNNVLLKEVFPKCCYRDYRRALCVIDPYDLNPVWDVMVAAGQSRSIEVFHNFMIMDANMNILWSKPDAVSSEQSARMNAFWGDDSWRTIAYKTQPGLFEDFVEKATNEQVVKAYQKRLHEVAGFKYVVDPVPLRNTNGATVYYLFFASNNETGAKIARSIFNSHRNKGLIYGS